MIGHPTTWVMLEPGMYLQAADATIWRVDAKSYNVQLGAWVLRITDAAGNWADVGRPADAPVTVMVPTIDEAEMVVAQALPVAGVLRRVIRMEHIATHPDGKWVRAHLASHLLNLHHLSISATAHAENTDLAGLLEAHALAHARPEPDWIPHIHVNEWEL